MQGFFAAFQEYQSTADVYSTSAAGATLLNSGVLCIIVPNTEQGRWGPAPEGLGGARSDFWFFDVGGTAGLLPGYQVRQGTVTYICEGTADWGLGKVAGLSLPH